MSRSKSRIKSKALEALERDVLLYSQETNKDARYALYIRARDTAFKLRKLYEDEAPTKEEIDSVGHFVKVRPTIRKKHDALESYKGSYNYKPRGKSRVNNKRAAAVFDELAVRRRSIRWLKFAVPILERKREEDFFKTANRVLYGKTKTRSDKRGNLIGDAVGTIGKKNAEILITSRADEAKNVSNAKGNLVDKALRASSRDVKNYLAKRQGRAVGRTLKKVYRG